MTNKVQIMGRLTVLLLFICCIHVTALGQYAYQEVPDAVNDVKRRSLKSILMEFQDKYQVSITFKDADIQNKLVKEVDYDNENPEVALQTILTPFNLKFDKVKEGVYVVTVNNQNKQLQNAPESQTEPSAIDKINIPQLVNTQLETTVSGRVISEETGEGIPGVNIVIKGTTTGTITDFNGNYEIQVQSASDVLVFSYIGYTTQEVTVGNKTTIDISLETSGSILEEVVVVAYGTVKKGENTSSTAQINYEEISNRPISNVASALEGAAPGIQSLSASGQPGSTPSIRIRGFGSINASSNPLFVVDGVVYDGGLSNLNMEDVASITVMKDAASTALYGSRGANGVIIITTKKGNHRKDGLSFKATHGYISRAIPEYDRVDAYEYYPLMWQSYRNSLIASGQDPTTASQNASAGIKTELGYNPFDVPDDQIVLPDGTLNPEADLLWADDLDWAKAVERTGVRKEYSLSYNGGNETSTYYGSFGYVDEEGFVINSGQERYMARLNVITEPLSWIKTGINLSGVISNSQNARVESSTRIDNPFYFTKAIGPIYPIHAHDPVTGEYLLDGSGNSFHDYGNMIDYGIPFRPAAAFGGKHIVAETMLNSDKYERNALSGRTFVDLNFTEDIKFTTNLSVDLSNGLTSVYGNNIIGNDAPSGFASRGVGKSRSITFNQLLNYTKSFNNHNLSFLLGHENYDFNMEYIYTARQGQIVAGNYELNNFAIITDSDSYIDKHRIESYFSRINYDFDGTYFISASFRRDGNSRFKKEYRWDNFYSLGLAWRLDREAFVENIDWIDVLKLRGSYGRVGNDAGIGYYPYQALYTLGFNNAEEEGIRQSALPNDEITWEGQKITDVAVDFALLDHRLSGTVEYYHRNSDDLIFSVQLPLSLGGYFLQKNIGAMTNKGLELELNGDIIRNSEVTWNLGVNLSTLKNEITRMPPDQEEIISGTKKLAVGHSIYDYWLPEWQGVDPETGLGLYRADDYIPANSFARAEGDTVTTDPNNARYSYAGSAIPDVFGSITNRVSYKGFELSLLLTFQKGGLVYDATYAGLMHSGTYGASLHKDALNAWQQPGDVTDVPKLQNGLTNPTSSRYLTDASYMNIRSLSLAYNLPSSLISRIKAEQVRVFISGENLHWFSDRKGMNVQQSFTGVTSNVYMPAKTISAGINVQF